jgi:hypothetical protein
MLADTQTYPPTAEAENDKKVLTTADLIPIKVIERDTILTGEGNYVKVIRMPGNDIKLMSATEKAGLIRREAAMLATIEEGLAFYAYSAPKNIQPLVDELALKREAEKDNLKLREQFWVEQNHLEDLNEQSRLTQREYFCTIRARPGDIKQAKQAMAAAAATDDGDEPQRKITLKNLLKYGIKGAATAPVEDETAPGASKKRARQDDGVNADIAGSLSFKTEGLARQLSGKALKTAEIVDVLKNMFGSQAAEGDSDGAELSSLEQIGNVPYKETANYVKLGETYISCIYITELPRALKAAALFDILTLHGIELNIGVHVQPLPKATAEKKLKNKQKLLGAVAASSNSQDLNRDVRMFGIANLLQRIARDGSRLYAVNLTIAVRSVSYKKLMIDLQHLTQRLTEADFVTATATRFQFRAFLSTIPIGECFLTKDRFMLDRVQHPNLPSENVACLLPNRIPDYSRNGGIMIGMSELDGGLVTYNRWLPDASPHSAFIAGTGGGKSYALMKEPCSEMLKNPALGVYFIDPQDGIGLTRLVEGARVDMGLKGNAIINPVDRYILGGEAEEIGGRVTFLTPLVELMINAELTAGAKAALAQALKRLYNHFEGGESIINILALSFNNNALYAPIQSRLPDVLKELQRIYVYLKEKYRLPDTGLVKGKGGKNKTRPVCYLNTNENRYYYRGEGMTTEPFEPVKRNKANKLQGQPAGVWYPDPVWFNELREEFSELVQESGVFDGLDLIALQSAIRDAFVELRLGMPILSDLFVFLNAEGASNLVSNLSQFADPELFGKLFNGFTNVKLDNRFICFNILDLDDGLLRPIRIFQVIDFTWGQVRALRLPRMFICDEFGILVESNNEVANYIRNLYMRGRFFGLSMTIVVQNLASLVTNKAAKICLDNAGRVVLLRQPEASAARELQAHYGLTDTQAMLIQRAAPGESLQLIDKNWVHVKYSIPQDHLKGFDMRPEEQKEAVKISAS